MFNIPNFEFVLCFRYRYFHILINFKLESDNSPLITSFAKSKNEEDRISHEMSPTRFSSKIDSPDEVLMSDNDCKDKQKMLKSSARKHRPDFVELRKHRKHKKRKKHKKNRKNIYEVVSSTQGESNPIAPILDETQSRTPVDSDISRQSPQTDDIEIAVENLDNLNKEDEEIASRDNDNSSNYSSVDKVSWLVFQIKYNINFV